MKTTLTKTTVEKALAALLVFTFTPLLTAGLLASFRLNVSAKVSQRTLTFAERVAYQHAIEDVYWRRRIWPKENPEPKPSLDAVISQSQLEAKVEDYLRNSHALEDYWQRPITAEQLQAEMDRMAWDTKQPEVLRELFEALGNDPAVIAECLARPLLTGRLIADLSTRGETRRLQSARAYGLRTMSAPLVQITYTLSKITGSWGDLPYTDDTWTTTNIINSPDGRYIHTAVWTGTEMIVWGGANLLELNTGGKYNPSTDSWTATSTTNAPSPRHAHTAVWTGTEMMVWGGVGGVYLNTGGRYNPITDSWTASSTTNAPEARAAHTAIWSGGEMIVWGGLNMSNLRLNTGGRYNPITDSWTATSTTNAPEAREYHTAVWTGSEMIVWGGTQAGRGFNGGGRYNPSTDTWTATSTTNAPGGRYQHTAVWTGNKMIVWGGGSDGTNTNTGGRYDPGTDSWTATSSTNAPSARGLNTTVWTGSEMIIWGGLGDSYLNTGGRYNPTTDTWTITSTTNAAGGRYYHTAVWSGSEMIVWGGNGVGNVFLNTGGRYCAQAGGGLTLESAASIQRGFAIDLPLSGPSGVEDRSGGPNKKFYVAMTFNNNITSVGSATMTCGVVSTWTISGPTVTFELVGVAHGCNESDITITANDVIDDMGNTLASASVAMGLLLGDVNGDRVVDGTDLGIVRGYRGQHTDGTNYRSDVSNDGFINASDVQLVQQQQGTSLP